MSMSSTPQTPDAGSEHLENEIELKEIAGLSQGQIVRGRFFRHKGAMTGLFLVVAVALLAFTSVGVGPIPGWWKYTGRTDPKGILNGGRPTGEHPFGQDELGRDMFAQVMKGIQTSLMVMVVIGLVACIMGVLVGSLSGYFRGKLDTA